MNKKFLRILFTSFIVSSVLVTQCEAKGLHKISQKVKKVFHKKSASKVSKTDKTDKVSKAEILNIVVDTLKNQFVIVNNSFSKNLEAEDLSRVNKKSLLKSKSSIATSHDLQNFIKKLKSKFIGDSINCLTALTSQVENITKTRLQGVDEILALKEAQVENEEVQKLIWGDDIKEYDKARAKYWAINKFENMDVLFKTPKAQKISNDPLVEDLKIKAPAKEKEMRFQTKMKNVIYKYLKQDISEMMRLAKKIEKDAKALTKFKKLSDKQKEQAIKKVSETAEEIAKILVKYTLQWDSNSKPQYDEFDVTDAELDALVEDSDKREKYLAEKYGSTEKSSNQKVSESEKEISKEELKNSVKEEKKENPVESKADKKSTSAASQNKIVSSKDVQKKVQPNSKEEKSELEKRLEARRKKIDAIENQKVLDFSMTDEEIKSETKSR